MCSYVKNLYGFLIFIILKELNTFRVSVDKLNLQLGVHTNTINILTEKNVTILENVIFLSKIH